jgi:hypothetical protein
LTSNSIERTVMPTTYSQVFTLFLLGENS